MPFTQRRTIGAGTRQGWMGLLARAPTGRATALFSQSQPEPEHEWLRQPEIGSVMVRGRIGGTGTPFNLGEMTVTRCSVRLLTGEVGHGYVQGRRKACAKTAALIDALMQTSQAANLLHAVLTPLAEEFTAAKTARAEKAEATKVSFFTMSRGETR